MNKFIATGKLIKIGTGKKFDSHLTLYFKRTDQPDTFLTFAYSGVLDSSIQINDVITVEGFLRGYSKKNENNTWAFFNTFEATSIKKAQTEIEQEFKLPGHFNPNHSFVGLGEGKVRKVNLLEDHRKTLLVAIYAENENNPEMVTLILKNHDKIQQEFDEIKKGDHISFVINAQSQRKNVNSRDETFVNLIVHDLSITGQ